MPPGGTTPNAEVTELIKERVGVVVGQVARRVQAHRGAALQPGHDGRERAGPTAQRIVRRLQTLQREPDVSHPGSLRVLQRVAPVRVGAEPPAVGRDQSALASGVERLLADLGPA